MAARRDHIKNKDFLWIHVETRMLESDLTSLKEGAVLASTSTGTTHVPNRFLEELKERFVFLKGESNLLREVSSTAELAWFFVLASRTNALSASSHVQSGIWDRSAHLRKTQVRNPVVGVIGFGRLGEMLAGFAKAFGCRVLVVDINQKARLEAERLGYETLNTLKEIFETCQVVSVHVDTVQGSNPIITKEIFSSATKDLCLVNTSRGSVVDEDAIVQAIDNSFLGSYYTDVLEFEENSGNLTDSRIWKKSLEDSRVFVTPHIGGASLDAMEMCEQNILSRVESLIGKSWPILGD